MGKFKKIFQELLECELLMTRTKRIYNVERNAKRMFDFPLINYIFDSQQKRRVFEIDWEWSPGPHKQICMGRCRGCRDERGFQHKQKLKRNAIWNDQIGHFPRTLARKFSFSKDLDNPTPILVGA